MAIVCLQNPKESVKQELALISKLEKLLHTKLLCNN